jgi:glyoxylase-like metal-dependent hydrolase (beta-lactamase superfamily II)
MTLDGTNTWVLVEPGADRAVVVDPGPADPMHLQAVLAAVASAGAARVGVIALTHGHPDHAEAAPGLAEMTGAPIRARASTLCRGAEPFGDGERLMVDGLVLEVVATPGHTADSVSFVLADDEALLTGDTVLGRGSTVVAHPDGRLADYLVSLRELRSIVEQRGVRVVLPGHGPVRDDPGALITGYLRHREERLAQVRAAVEGAATVDDLLNLVYPDVDPALLPAARWSLLAQLEYLAADGLVVPQDPLSGSGG